MDRTQKLTSAWVGKPVILGGRELRVSVGRYSLLEQWRNPFFVTTDRAAVSQVHALGEMMMVFHADSERIKELRSMSESDRAASVTDFLIEHDGEIESKAEELMAKISNTEAAMTEPDETLGKSEQTQDANHAT